MVTPSEMTTQAERAESAARNAHSAEERQAFLHIARAWREMAATSQRPTEAAAKAA